MYNKFKKFSMLKNIHFICQICVYVCILIYFSEHFVSENFKVNHFKNIVMRTS